MMNREDFGAGAVTAGVVQARRRPGDRASMDAGAAEPGEVRFSYDEAVGRCFGSEELLRSMVGSFEREGELLALDAAEAVESGHCDEVGQRAHRLRNAAVYLGAEPVVLALRELERAARQGSRVRLRRLLGLVIDQTRRLREAIRREPRLATARAHGR